jgi:hypothetical protein
MIRGQCVSVSYDDVPTQRLEQRALDLVMSKETRRWVAADGERAAAEEACTFSPALRPQSSPASAAVVSASHFGSPSTLSKWTDCSAAAAGPAAAGATGEQSVAARLGQWDVDRTLRQGPVHYSLLCTDMH